MTWRLLFRQKNSRSGNNTSIQRIRDKKVLQRLQQQILLCRGKLQLTFRIFYVKSHFSNVFCITYLPGCRFKDRYCAKQQQSFRIIYSTISPARLNLQIAGLKSLSSCGVSRLLVVSFGDSASVEGLFKNVLLQSVLFDDVRFVTVSDTSVA